MGHPRSLRYPFRVDAESCGRLSRRGTLAFVSSGAWSLVGVEIADPVLGETTRGYNLSNEGGYAGTTNLLRNVMGSWLVQGCRARWALQDGQATSYDDLMILARQASAFTAVIDPDDPRLLRPADMPATIVEICRQGGQSAPATRGQVLRVVLESLALRYRWALDALAAALGRRITSLHVSGGGSTNKLLCEMTAGATRVPVSAYDPPPGEGWEDAYGRFQALASVGPIDSMRALRPGL